jgi:hypothetical protein
MPFKLEDLVYLGNNGSVDDSKPDGVEIDIENSKWRYRFQHSGVTWGEWCDIGKADNLSPRAFGVLGVYDRTNNAHLKAMIYDYCQHRGLDHGVSNLD